jgi:alkanesulfonate monooxygenase SsuD/methylene tetrahydromethanopterin reductase-like flavin-dependent oxidoreductase (luciferase family)
MGVKVILQLYPMMPAKDDADRERRRPLGRDRELYHEVAHGMTDIVKACDDLGFWGVSAIEHHFHSEGYELGPNPGLLNAFWAAVTRNVRVGQLGYVMSAQNPFRVAEETAILDHLARGRSFVGFARGYQSRWTNIIGQHLGSRATLSDGSSDDAHNRRLFEEQVELVLKCWTQESVEHRGEFFQVPFPYETGVTDYPAADTAARFGAPGEIGAAGEVRRVSVVPAPYQRPHPPVFISTTVSPASAEYAARMGFIPAFIAPHATAVERAELYRERALDAGHAYAPGQNVALVRWLRIVDRPEAYDDALRAYDLSVSENFYAKFRARQPGRASTPAGVGTLEALKDDSTGGIYMGGTVDEVRRRFVKEWEQLPAEYLILISHYAQQPKQAVIQELEAFATKVMPEIGGFATGAPASATPTTGA